MRPKVFDPKFISSKWDKISLHGKYKDIKRLFVNLNITSSEHIFCFWAVDKNIK